MMLERQRLEQGYLWVTSLVSLLSMKEQQMQKSIPKTKRFRLPGLVQAADIPLERGPCDSYLLDFRRDVNRLAAEAAL